jgi:D-aspartate ligase
VDAIQTNDKKLTRDTVHEMYKNGAVIIGCDFQGLGIVHNLADLHIPIIVVDPDFCIGKFSKFVQKYYKCPSLRDIESFTAFLERLAIEENLKNWVVFPTNDEAVYILSKQKDRLSKYYLIPTPAWETTKYAYDKKLTCQLAEKLSIPVPKTFFFENEENLLSANLDFPVVLKPSIKDKFFPTTKLKAIQANNKDELLQFYKYMAFIIDKSEIMVQEKIQGGANNLYSFCSLFGDGKVKAKIIAKRQRQHPMDFGRATTFAYTCKVPELEELAVRILKEMNYYGLSEVEFMYDDNDGTYKLLEINARTWGWHTLGSKAGVNFSAFLFMDMNHQSFSFNGFEENVKWIRMLTDVPIVISEMYKKRLRLADYFDSIRGKKQFAVFSKKDPLPAVMEVLLAPYFWYKRGWFTRKIWRIL